LCVEKFILERLQRVVVKLELDFEGAIGHAPTSLKEHRDLLEHLVKIHPSPPHTCHVGSCIDPVSHYN
jgi:hypothetical protein